VILMLDGVFEYLGRVGGASIHRLPDADAKGGSYRPRQELNDVPGNARLHAHPHI
jgi:hypothetical protein